MRPLLTTAALVLLSSASLVRGDIVEFDYSGTVDGIVAGPGVNSSLYSDWVSGGDAISGSFSYDLDLSDPEADGTYLITNTLEGALSYETGDSADSTRLIYSSSGTTDPFSVTINDGGSDQFVQRANDDNVGTAPPEVGYVTVSIELTDTDGTVFGSEALPATLSLDDFEAASVTYTAYTSEGGDPLFRVDGTISTLTQTTSVPEPSTMLLLACGAAGGWFYRRRRNRP